MTINEFIFKTLDKKKLKQADLAKYLNVEKSVINSWKRRGNDPPSTYLVQICTFLDVDVYELLGIEKTKVNNKFSDKILNAYYSADTGTQKSVLKLLDIETEEEQPSNLYTSKIG